MSLGLNTGEEKNLAPPDEVKQRCTRLLSPGLASHQLSTLLALGYQLTGTPTLMSSQPPFLYHLAPIMGSSRPPGPFVFALGTAEP